MKRLFDLVSAFFGLILLSPLLILVALAIKLTSPGPVLFGQVRVGLGGRPFRMWKFRSMRPDSEATGPSITIGDDKRITAIGRLIRKTKMDELPQLWNVLTGEMSLVGPRPEVEKYTRLYSDEHRRVLDLKPGITDPASFAFYNESEVLAHAADPEAYYVERVMLEKIRINLEYARKRNFLSDLVVILGTVARPLGVRINMFSLLKLTPPSR